MPILKVRQTNNEWFDVRKLTLDELDLGNDIKLSSNKTDDNKKLLLVNGKKILDKSDYDNLNGLIQNNTNDISTIKGKLTEFYEIDATNGVLDLEDELKNKKKIHAFIDFNGKKPDIRYGTDKYIEKGDDIRTLEKANICELDAYKYDEKLYIIWKNWVE